MEHNELLGGDIPDSAANPVGHHESASLVNVDEQLLQACGCSWDQPFAKLPNWRRPALSSVLEQGRQRLTAHGQNRLWIDKDPRLCLTRPAIEQILARPIPAIAILRHPLAVARSLQQRDGFNLHQSARIWWLYNRHLFNSPCQPPSAVLLFNQLLINEPHQHQHLLGALDVFLQRVNQEAGAAGAVVRDGAAARPECLNRLLEAARRPDLVHSTPIWPDPAPGEQRLASELTSLWQQVEAFVLDQNQQGLAQLFAGRLHNANPPGHRRGRLKRWLRRRLEPF